MLKNRMSLVGLVNDKKSYRITIFLEYKFIPKVIEMKKYRNSLTNEFEVIPSIKLSYITSLNYNNEELKYVFYYLSKLGIFVSGKPADFYLEHFNYITENRENSHYNTIKYNEDDLLIKEYQETKNKGIKNKIIENNIGLVKYLAYRMALLTRLDREELESYGYEGLIKAVDKFDCSKGYRFFSYIYTCVEHALYNGVRQITTIKNDLFYKTFRFYQDMIECQKGESISDDYSIIYEILKIMVQNNEMSESEAKHYANRMLIKYSDSLDNGNYNNILVFENPDFNDIENSTIFENVSSGISTLKCFDQEVIKVLYGIDRDKMTEVEFAKKYYLSHQGVSQRKQKALIRLRHPSRVCKFKMTNSEELNEIPCNYSQKLVKNGQKF